MSTSCFAERLGHYIELTDIEKTALARLEENERSYRKGALIRREREPVQEMYVIKRGWAFSCALLADGGRQILRLHFPGDLIGTSALAFQHATHTLVALTDITLCPFDTAAMRGLFIDYPRLAGLFFAVSQVEHVALTDRLASLGRTSARARVAALLLDTLYRLRVMHPDSGNDFSFPLTQEEIGDATGLTAVHVNRMFRALEEAGLIVRRDGRIAIPDEARLAALAAYENRYDLLATGWLPPPVQR